MPRNRESGIVCRMDIQPVWPPQLVLDIALEAYELPDLLLKYGLTEADLDAFYAVEQFRRELIHTRAELAETGSSFRAHARVLAEAHLSTMNDILGDVDVGAQTKVMVWQALVKFADLEPVKPTGGGGDSAKVVVEIKSFGSQAPVVAGACVAQDGTPAALTAPTTQITISAHTEACRGEYSADEWGLN